METDTPAMRRIKAARSYLLRNRPHGVGAFFGQLAMRLELQEDPKSPATMMTNGRILKFDPKAVMALPQEHVVSLVAHEVIHVSSQHHLRRRQRDAKKWNLACDAAVNAELKAADFPMPPGAFYNPKFDGMSAERIYTLLDMQESGGGQSQGQGQGQGNFRGDFEDPTGEDGEGLSEQEMQAEAQDWQIASVQAAAAAQKMGKLPAFAERLLGDLRRPRSDPWERLREFVKERQDTDSRWTPPNRRFVADGLYLPSRYSEDELGEIVIAIDTSGSIGGEILNEFGRHVSAIHEDFRPKKITILWADAAVAGVQEFERDQPLEFLPAGGGGTDFRPCFQWIEKHREEPPECMIYLTDLMGVFPDNAPTSYPVLWAATTDCAVPWGEVIRIPV